MVALAINFGFDVDRVSQRNLFGSFADSSKPDMICGEISILRL